MRRIRRLTALVANVKAAGRDLTDAECDEVEQKSARVILLKSIIERGEKNADLINQLGDLGPGVHHDDGGLNDDARNRTDYAGAKGFITPASLKRMATAGATQGVKALIAAGSNATPVQLDTNPIPMGQPSLGLLSLIPTKVRETRKYSYLRQVTATNNADVVAAGAEKPTSVYTVQEFDNELDVIAHLSEYVDKYLLADNSDLETFLTSQLRDGIVRKVTALAVNTFLTTSGIQTQAFVNSAADSIYSGASAISDLGYAPSLVIVNRADYDAMRLEKETGTGAYIGGNPFEGGNRPGVWGFNTLISSDITAGTALVLAADQVGISTDKQGIEMVWDAISGFSSNKLRARTEGRFATDVFSPAAIAKVTLTSA